MGRDRKGWGAWLVGAVVLSLVLAGCGAPGGGGGSEIVIGQNTELTGAGANIGDLAKKAAELAVGEINDAGGVEVNGKKLKVKLITEDSASSNQGALAATNKIIDEDKALVMLGPVKSTQIQAINDTIQQKAIPTAIGGTNCQLTKRGNPWLVRLRPDDCIVGQAMAQFAVDDLKGQKIAIIHDSDAFGTGGKDEITKYLKTRNMEPVATQSYTTATENFQPQLLNIKNAGADVLLVYATNPSDAAKIHRQRRDIGLTAKAVGSPSSGQTITIDLGKEAMEDVYVAVDFTPNPRLDHYNEAWKKKYNADADPLSAWDYDAIYLMTDAIKKAGSTDPKDRQKIMDAIKATQDYQGAVGKITVDKDGNGIHAASIMQIKGGKLQFVKSITPQQ